MTTDHDWLMQAIRLSRQCPPATGAYSVGTVIVADGVALAEGYSREDGDGVHAEESALSKPAVRGVDPDVLARATLYTGLEPCSRRASRPRSCTQLILAAGIGRVVFGWREPPIFVVCDGAALLADAGVQVVELPELAAKVAAVNHHLLSDQKHPSGPRR